MTALLGYRLTFRGLLSSETNCVPRVGKKLRKEMDGRNERSKEAAPAAATTTTTTTHRSSGPDGLMDGTVEFGGNDDDVAGAERETMLRRRRLGDEEMGQSPGHGTSPLKGVVGSAESRSSLESSRVAENALHATGGGEGSGGVRGFQWSGITESGYISFSTLRGTTAERVGRTFYGPERRSPRPEHNVEAGKSLSIS
ncbi:hypothetical protein PV08_06626 [Exophiala spinifera]|uniref:Uncharacterized protein n=1 Tax=Exophiala spinifera TaxID=91928 RepID=A0A0D1YFK1_9EURO|nr:uncharacterized protein PV08_06626 [Exophiala spinifera]KIW13846.1 hypothetical protein PV08_06626 [Exophiala spinifera]